MSRRLMELLTYAQVNKEFFNGDANQLRTRYIIAESDLRSIYQEIFGRELSKAYDETLSLEETQAIYRKCRERGMVICEQIVPENGEAKDSILEETMIDIALVIGYKLSKKQYWKAIRKKADTLAAAKELKQSALFLGDFSGFGGCHEIALWFPYPISKNKVYRILLHIVTKSYMK